MTTFAFASVFILLLCIQDSYCIEIENLDDTVPVWSPISTSLILSLALVHGLSGRWEEAGFN